MSSIIREVGDGGASGSPPCSSHTVINDPSRNMRSSGIGGTCDNGPFFNTSIGGRWIRFKGTGGTVMPHTSPGFNHCGSFLAGWYNGTLPLTEDTVVNGTVCFSGDASSCQFPIYISIINCDYFYVYFLRPVEVCNARYCTT